MLPLLLSVEHQQIFIWWEGGGGWHNPLVKGLARKTTPYIGLRTFLNGGCPNNNTVRRGCFSLFRSFPAFLVRLGSTSPLLPPPPQKKNLEFVFKELVLIFYLGKIVTCIKYYNLLPINSPVNSKCIAVANLYLCSVKVCKDLIDLITLFVCNIKPS